MKRILLGIITSPHGIRGTVKIQFFGEDPKNLERAALWTSETGTQHFKLKLLSSSGKSVLAHVEGVSDRNMAETLRGIELWIDRDMLPELEENSFYIEDLSGLQVRLVSGDLLGIVQTVQNFGASDLLDVQPPSGSSFYIPFAEHYVVSVDLENREIIVDLPDGFLEL